MKTRNLGRSGLKITEIAYGNWLTHGSQVEEDAALACVQRALEVGITTFDTADVYAATRAESEIAPRAPPKIESGRIVTSIEALSFQKPSRMPSFPLSHC